MKKFIVRMSSEAKWDLQQVYHHIAYVLMAPMTAMEYHNGIIYTIEELSIFGGIYALTQSAYLQSLYGAKTYTTRHKKMIIIYNIIGDVVFVRRIVAGSLIR
jgi:hypothetical protein